MLGAQHEMLKARAENAEAGRAQLSKEKLLLEVAVQKHDAEKKQLEEEARLLQQTVQVRSAGLGGSPLLFAGKP